MNTHEAREFAAGLFTNLPEIDLHGLYPSEALDRLEMFLYQEHMKKSDVVRVIYGVGTGVLRKEVFQRLKNHALVDQVVETGSGSCVAYIL